MPGLAAPAGLVGRLTGVVAACEGGAAGDDGACGELVLDRLAPPILMRVQEKSGSEC